MTQYRNLHQTPLPAHTRLSEVEMEPPAPVGMDDPAVRVMTDLTRVRAVTIAPDAPLAWAHHHMVHAKVRMLFVTDMYDAVVGLLTARDLLGEKPVRVAVDDAVARDDVRVERVMVRREHIQALDYAEVLRSSVGDVVQTLRASGRQHALAIESGHVARIRGVFSTSQIGRQLGVQLDASEHPQSFAEIEHLLGTS